MRLVLFWPRQKCYLWSNACHPCDQPSSVNWQNRKAPCWAWREIRRHVVQVVRGHGHSSGMEQRANIKFCFNLGKTAAETVELMRQVYGDNSLSLAQIFRWYARFKSGVETIEDEARHGRPFSLRNVTRDSLRKWENEYKKNVVWHTSMSLNFYLIRYLLSEEKYFWKFSLMSSDILHFVFLNT